MSNSAENSKNNLSAVERLKAMDKYLDQMRDILTSMDEISKLREQRGEPASDEFGGYKRSSVLNLVRGLEQQKESILAEIAAEEAKRKEGAVVPAAAEQNAPAAEGRASSLGPRESAVQAFRQGDASLAIESMYTGLSMDIEKMRDDILQEMKYTYKQDMAIYDDLSEKIESLRRTEGVNFEDSLRPIGEGITALDEKINALQPVDYDVLADRVAARVVAGGIDYDALAKHIVAVMAGAGVGAAAAVAADNAQAGVSERKLEELDRKLDDLKNTLNGAVSVKQMPEFRKLDTLIAQYLRTMSYDLIPDILVSANSAREIANRYIVSGNTLRGETMLSDLRVRLSRVNVWGADALTVIEDAIRQNGLPVIYAEDALSAFKEASAAFEQSPAVPDEQLASRVVAAKKALFLDTDMEALDRDTFTEMLEIRDEIGDSVKLEDTHRLLWLHLPPFYDSSLLDYIEVKCKAPIVFEEVNFVGWEPLDPKDPYRSLARKILTVGFMDPALRVETIVENAPKVHYNGCILYNHGFGRCSMADSSFIKHLREELNKAAVPLLVLDGDCVDTTIDPCSTETKISAYVEALNEQKYGNIFGRLKA